jgi:nucleoside-diphosphate-sugar epimerase
MRVLVTGATGLIGRHVVERLVADGLRVTALIRPGTSPLEEWGAAVETVTGDVTDGGSLDAAVQGQDCVVHAAGIAGDGAPRAQLERVLVDGTAHTLAAAAGLVPRFVHISSVAVYDHPDRPVVEDDGFARHTPPWNHYSRAKIAAERLVWSAHRAGAFSATVLRPSIVLGLGDRSTTPRILRLLRSTLANFALINGGAGPIPCVTASDLAEAVARVIATAGSAGRAYNLSGQETLTLSTLLRLHAEASRLRMPRRPVSPRVAVAGATAVEFWYRLTGAGPPPLSRFLVWIAGAACRVDSSRAAQELSWEGRTPYDRAVGEAVTWDRTRREGSSPTRG